jgi:hypothetical protein
MKNLCSFKRQKPGANLSIIFIAFLVNASALAVSPGGIVSTPSGTLGMQRANVAGNNLIAAGAVLSAVANPPPAVPVRAATWLFGSGLIGLIGICQHIKFLQP